MNGLKKSLKTTLARTSSIFGLFIIALILFMSTRGNLGNPNSLDLHDTEWRENGPFELSPERGRYALAKSLIDTKSVYLTTDLARFILPDVGYRDGRYVSLFAPTTSFFIIPGYLIGEKFEAAQLGSYLVIGVFGIMNVLLIIAISKQFKIHAMASKIAAIIFLFASPAFAYATNLYQHHISTFILLMSIHLVLKETTFFNTLIIFFLYALGLTVDYPNVFFIAPVLLSVAKKIITTSINRREIHAKIKVFLITSVIGTIFPLIFFMWFNNLSYGGPFKMLGGSAVLAVRDITSSGEPIFEESGDTKEVSKLQTENDFEESTGGLSYFKTRNLVNGLLIHLIGADRGIVYFSPILLVAIFGFSFAYKRNHEAATLLVFVAVINLLLYSMWGDPWGGWAFGSRYLIPSYAVLSIFLAAFLDKYRRNIPMLMVFLLIAGYSVYVNTAGALSSSANPPKVQVLSLEALSGKRERYSWDRNIEYLRNGNSKAFAFQVWFKEKITAWNYFRIIAGSISAVIICMTIVLYTEKKIGEKLR